MKKIHVFKKLKHKWVNAGEDRKSNLMEARLHFEKYAKVSLKSLRQLIQIYKYPTDTLSFIKYTQDYGNEPQSFIMNKLKNYKLVMFGEIHRRKSSWDFLDSIIHQKQFTDYAGTIFMEMASNKQSDIDQFFANDFVDKELLLNIFRDYMITGWNDKGKYDFLISVWHINQELPVDRKIKVVATDTPRIFTEEGIKNERFDRDDYMANVIMNYFDSKTDSRNTLFIVGSGHVYKSNHSAGLLLSERMQTEVYTIFTHSPRVDNYIKIPERIRGGMFDIAFHKNNNKPVAFELKNSPFGKEPFDGLYMDGSGTFQDNFDGYIFFGALEEEPNGELLLEMFTDDFIIEIDRRYKLYNRDFMKSWEIRELSKVAVIEKIKRF